MGFDLRLTAMAFVGLWSLVLGARNCATSSESMTDKESATLCQSLLEGSAQSLCVEDAAPFLATIYDMCITEVRESASADDDTEEEEGANDDDDDDEDDEDDDDDDDDDDYEDDEPYLEHDDEDDEDDDDEDDEDDDDGIVALSGGFEAQCELGSEGPFVSRSVELLGDSDEYVARWVLNSKVVDVTQKVTAQFRFSSQEDTEIKVSSGSYSELELALPASVDNGTYCMSEAVDVTPVQTTGSDGATIYVIKARGHSFSDSEAMLEGLVLAFETVSGASDAASEDAQNYACVEGRSAFAECDPSDSSSDDCACLDNNGDVRELYNEMDLNTIIPLCVLGFSVALFAGIVYKFRSSVTVKHRESCWRRNCCRTDDDSSNGGPRKVHGARGKALHIDCPEQGEETHHVQLSDILADTTERKYFSAYLERKGTVEPMLLFESIEHFETCEDRLWRQREARNMIARFIAPHAPYSVELRQSTRTALCNAKGAPKTLFEVAKAEVYANMQISFLEDFLATRNSGSYTPRRQSPRSHDSFDITTSDSVPAVIVDVDVVGVIAEPFTGNRSGGEDGGDDDGETDSRTQQLGVV
ncbi:Hypothetical Protein FCC1311_087272 [Hondaea fermentalgiana]|uniref:RGS domain-containing protein n=1 Tax=Hondaea fermentalgiana TaxID=2315210 RepID=A0A2R5GNN3_9STRA|nr:Hypothetical Protein FCC1311_087272 [Hondaea fermentalgiana]|eukprot:GBG32502.1 Hypothetical Protein FCC1311_087272 [Hondaea fermentalgiana]